MSGELRNGRPGTPEDLIAYLKAEVIGPLQIMNESLRSELSQVKAELETYTSSYRMVHRQKIELCDERDSLKEKLQAAEAECAGYRKALKLAGEHCICSRNTYGFDYSEEHIKLGKPKSGVRWLTPLDIIEKALEHKPDERGSGE